MKEIHKSFGMNGRFALQLPLAGFDHAIVKASSEATHFLFLDSSGPQDADTARPLHEADVVARYDARTWPGTTVAGAPSARIVLCKNPLKYACFFFANVQDLVFSHAAMEDLTLLRGNNILYSCVSHERFGILCGEQNFFGSMGLTGLPRKGQYICDLSGYELG
ncbi:MAG: hypothetical protein PHX58_03985 [Desulfovibrio sp.]|jgi:hypothetical protein|nr:hypothetical protein [Desulfovibrio sp.]